MTVKQLIQLLNKLPHDSEVFYLTTDGGLHDVTKAMKAIPEHEEVKTITGDEFVLLE